VSFNEFPLISPLITLSIRNLQKKREKEKAYQFRESHLFPKTDMLFLKFISETDMCGLF